MVVVDTDVLSYIFKRHPAGAPFIDALEGRRLVVSFMTVAEIELGMVAAAWGDRLRHRMRRHLHRYEAVESNWEICRYWASVMQESASKGRPMSHEDGWIAATALYLRVPLATNNRRHFQHLDRIRLLVP